MKKVMGNWMKAWGLACVVILNVACEDKNELSGKGNVQFEITDGPADDANVKGVFVTVSDIKVDGKSIGGVVKTTLDLKSFTEGNTKVLALASQFEARTYNDVTLVLDLNTDANGAAPGCFVQTLDGTRYKLKTTEDGLMEITLSKEYEVVSNATTRVVLDFDIRKSIFYDMDDQVRYRFVGDREMSEAIRLKVKEETGWIKGAYSENLFLNKGKVIVYAYRKGTFSASTETQPQGVHQMYFMNAAGSAEVKPGMGGRSFTLAYLDEGDYELYFASFSEASSGRLLFNGVLQAEMNVGGTVGNRISVKEGTTVNVSTLVKGIL